MTTNNPPIADRLDQIGQCYHLYGFDLVFKTHPNYPSIRSVSIQSKIGRLHKYFLRTTLDLNRQSIYAELDVLESFAETLNTIDITLQYFNQLTAEINVSYRNNSGSVTIRNATWFDNDKLYDTRRKFLYRLTYMVSENTIQVFETSITLPWFKDYSTATFTLPHVNKDYELRFETDVEIFNNETYELSTQLFVTRKITSVARISELDNSIQDISRVGETILNTLKSSY
jgi:hypothetical protein